MPRIAPAADAGYWAEVPRGGDGESDGLHYRRVSSPAALCGVKVSGRRGLLAFAQKCWTCLMIQQEDADGA